MIQYDVASNAVEFMHRIGRTARAGMRIALHDILRSAHNSTVDTVPSAAIWIGSARHRRPRCRAGRRRLRSFRRSRRQFLGTEWIETFSLVSQRRIRSTATTLADWVAAAHAPRTPL